MFYTKETPHFSHLTSALLFASLPRASPLCFGVELSLCLLSYLVLCLVSGLCLCVGCLVSGLCLCVSVSTLLPCLVVWPLSSCVSVVHLSSADHNDEPVDPPVETGVWETQVQFLIQSQTGSDKIINIGWCHKSREQTCPQKAHERWALSQYCPPLSVSVLTI